MTKSEELSLFIEKTDAIINGKYVLADIKIINLLKSVATCDTLLALFKNCLQDFEYEKTFKSCFISDGISDGKGVFTMPTATKDFLALVFTVLVNIDNRQIVLGDFLNKYFYEDGSFSTSYSLFVNNMIKPFKTEVISIMEKIIEGKIQDPIDAVNEMEEKRTKELSAKKEDEKENEKRLLKCEELFKSLKELLSENKRLIENGKFSVSEKADAILILDTFDKSLSLKDKDAIIYSFTAYKYLAKSHLFVLGKYSKTIKKAVMELINEL